MFFQEHSKLLATFLLTIFIVSQFLLISSFLLIPKPAKAFLGFGDLVIKIGDVYQVLKDIGLAVAKTIALKYVNAELSRFVDKLTEKYKIRNYLYYDQVLTNYYLNNYLRDKIADPDLRQIYSLLEASYITGQNTGYADQPNPNNALIPQLKRAIYNLYLKRGGISEDYIFNPPRNVSNRDYYNAAQLWALNRPGFVEQNLRGRFGEFQSSATTAAQLEIIVGGSLKAGRLIGGTCSLDPESTAPGAGIGDYLPGNPSRPDPNSSPTACESQGGTWQPSALDEARSFIDNPTAFVGKHIDSALNTIFDGNYNPNNIWSTIGSLLGSFIYNRLALDQPGGVLSEDPRAYVPSTGVASSGVELDIDSDGIMDGTDNNNDGTLDVCYWGGIAPNCVGSVLATTVPGGGGIPPGATPVTCSAGTAFQAAFNYKPQVQNALDQAIANNPSLASISNTDPTRDEVSGQLIDAAVFVLLGQGFNSGRAINCNGNNSLDALVVGAPSDPFAEYYDLWSGFKSGDGRTFAQMNTGVEYVEHANWGRCIGNTCRNPGSSDGGPGGASG
ncbi:MAG: hypothetical protein HYW51_01290 [Candidatus Doudnabacteria bacterium]|nr:hypothetical protein [Candidatus Doudnabacteria bacterium]